MHIACKRCHTLINHQKSILVAIYPRQMSRGKTGAGHLLHLIQAVITHHSGTNQTRPKHPLEIL